MKFWIFMGVLVALVLSVLFVLGKPLHPQLANHTSSSGEFADLVGKSAPDFSLNDLKGQSFNLESLRGKKVVLFFNEGIMCYPACWNQMAALGGDTALNNNQVVSASIVVDSSDEWGAALRKMPTLSKGSILLDTDASVSNRYGVLSLPSSMHAGVKPGHTYVVIDQKGIVRYTKDDPNMGINNELLKKEVEKL